MRNLSRTRGWTEFLNNNHLEYASDPKRFYSHSTLTSAQFPVQAERLTHVPGGFDVMSYTTLFTPLTSFVIRDEIFFNTAGGNTNLPVSCAFTARPLYPPVSSHKVLGRDRPDRNDLVVRPRVTSNTNRLHRQQRHEGLRDLVVQARSSDLLDVDVVRVLQNGDLITGDLSQDSDGKTRSGEGVSSDELGWDAEQSAERSHLVWMSAT